MPPRRPPGSSNAVLRWLSVLPLPFLFVFLGLAADALRITTEGLSPALPSPLQLGKALVLASVLLVGLPGLWSRLVWRRTLAQAVGALANASGTAHGIVWALIGRNGGLEGTDPRAPTWLVAACLAGAIVSASGFAAVAVLAVRDLRRQ